MSGPHHWAPIASWFAIDWGTVPLKLGVHRRWSSSSCKDLRRMKLGEQTEFLQAMKSEVRSTLGRKERAIDLLTKLAGAEVSEIEVDAEHVAATRNWMVRMFYQYGLEDAKRHLEIFTMIRTWMEQGKPPLGKVDVAADILHKEATGEEGVATMVKELLTVIDDSDAKALAELVLGDERRHEDGLKALRDRAK